MNEENKQSAASTAPPRPLGNNDADTPSARISTPEIAERLEIGRLAVYALLESGELPGIRYGRRWLVTRWAYEQ